MIRMFRSDCKKAFNLLVGKTGEGAIHYCAFRNSVDELDMLNDFNL